jgi:hypothetical protein
MPYEKCKYIFTNNSKNHKKGEICHAVIRKKTNGSYCWQHQHVQGEEIELNHPNIEDTEDEKIDFIQLENSSKK